MYRYIHDIDYSSEPARTEWRQFEQLVEESLNRALNLDQWEIHVQHTGPYIDGNFKMDFHIAERRRGGIAVVVDAKHFPRAWLNNHEIDTTKDYKRVCRANRALIIASSASNIHSSVYKYAEQLGVEIIKVEEHRNLMIAIRNYFRDVLTTWQNR
ncbi:MAG: restriction endonuclease [Coprothermobacterota bacterium]|nr:restriction endonuclease [Coprothermobacterota bacterium]